MEPSTRHSLLTRLAAGVRQFSDEDFADVDAANIAAADCLFTSCGFAKVTFRSADLHHSHWTSCKAVGASFVGAAIGCGYQASQLQLVAGHGGEAGNGGPTAAFHGTRHGHCSIPRMKPSHLLTVPTTV